jgi:hypothetical protein
MGFAHLYLLELMALEFGQSPTYVCCTVSFPITYAHLIFFKPALMVINSFWVLAKLWEIPRRPLPDSPKNTRYDAIESRDALSVKLIDLLHKSRKALPEQ